MGVAPRAPSEADAKEEMRESKDLSEVFRKRMEEFREALAVAAFWLEKEDIKDLHLVDLKSEEARALRDHDPEGALRAEDEAKAAAVRLGNLRSRLSRGDPSGRRLLGLIRRTR